MRAVLMMAFVTLVVLADPVGAEVHMKLKDVRSFMCQTERLEKPGAIEMLAKSNYDMLLVDPVFTLQGQEQFDCTEMVKKLHAGKPGRLVIACLNIGQAESYRTYWRSPWREPLAGQAGQPNFLLAPDPDGWNECYLVAYWNPGWQKIVMDEVQRIMRCGFDGLCLSWIDAYDEDPVIAVAKQEHVDPAKAMVDFLGQIRKQCLGINAAGVVLAQGAPYLIDDDRRYRNVVDGLLFEATWFNGQADARWNNPRSGDIANSSKGDFSITELMAQYRIYQKMGKPVFTLDYCIRMDNATKVYTESQRAGFVPLVTRVGLERMTETPPTAPSKARATPRLPEWMTEGAKDGKAE